MFGFTNSFSLWFGDIRNVDLLIHLLNSVHKLEHPIVKVTILNLFNDKEFQYRKLFPAVTAGHLSFSLYDHLHGVSHGDQLQLHLIELSKYDVKGAPSAHSKSAGSMGILLCER